MKVSAWMAKCSLQREQARQKPSKGSSWLPSVFALRNGECILVSRKADSSRCRCARRHASGWSPSSASLPSPLRCCTGWMRSRRPSATCWATPTSSSRRWPAEASAQSTAWAATRTGRACLQASWPRCKVPFAAPCADMLLGSFGPAGAKAFLAVFCQLSTYIPPWKL